MREEYWLSVMSLWVEDKEKQMGRDIMILYKKRKTRGELPLG